MLTLQEKITLRSKALNQSRQFFLSRGYNEVDVPICSREASVDAYIDLLEVKDAGFLHSSPELRMKDLLTNGSGDIFFLGHVFRKEEEGSKHSQEFTMLEYYKTETTEETFLKEFIDYIASFLGDRKVETLTYKELFKKYAPSKLPLECTNFTEEERRHYLLGAYIEPQLGKDVFTIVKDFPPQEASLAQVVEQNGEKVAKRFELFIDGIELANGFLELSCAQTALQRFQEANKKRLAQNKPPYPPDSTFIQNLKKGLPPSTYGIAVGFDRLLMLATAAPHIKDVIL